MGLNTRMEKSDDLTAVGVDLTFSSNAPTPGTTQTIANGSSMTDAESGQFAANVEAQLAAIVADLAELKSVCNAGE